MKAMFITLQKDFQRLLLCEGMIIRGQQSIFVILSIFCRIWVLHDLKLYTYKLNNSCLIYIHILSVRMDFSKHNQGTTSVKVHHAPGGRSNFSLAWDEGPTKPTKTAPRSNNPVVPLKETNQPTDAKTSVKVHNPPGGRSNIIFG